MNIHVSPSKAAAIDALCERIVAAAPRSLVLTGGTTAGAAYEQLASPAWRERIDWSTVTLLFGDERLVPPEDEGSCYRLADETLISRVGRSPSSACAGRRRTPMPRPSATPRCCPTRSTSRCSRWEDGHCASLFPGSPQLAERERLCVAGLAPYAPTSA